MTYKQEIIGFYNARTNYDNDVTINRAIALFEYAEPSSGQWVLDVATGTGNIAIPAAQKVGANGYVVVNSRSLCRKWNYAAKSALPIRNTRAN